MRVATFNVRHGRPRRGFASNRGLAATVAALDVDVLAVQEVERRVVRSWFADQPKRLASATSATSRAYAPARRLALTGSDGIALVVRGTIVDSQTIELRRVGVQRRIALVAHVVLADSERPVTLITTHLQNEAGAARTQLGGLLDTIASEPAPRILLGDLNLRPADVETRLASADFLLAGGPDTEPAWAPRQRIDHIAVHGFAVRSVEAPEPRVSDHRPLVAELERF
jgi:endonuclease/exonuclease/phosphatase family metal-dependent hydrolase